MPLDLDRVSRHFSQNLRRLRDLHGITQRQLAAQSGVPRPTIAKLEAGSPNPTMHVVVQLADALRVSVDELLAPPPSVGRLYTARELPTVQERGVERRQLVPHAIPGVTLERMAFAPDARLSGAPHPRGSREYLIVETGSVRLTTPAQRWHVGPGEVLAYQGDQTHGYHNPGQDAALAFTLIVHASAVSAAGP